MRARISELWRRFSDSSFSAFFFVLASSSLRLISSWGFILGWGNLSLLYRVLRRKDFFWLRSVTYEVMQYSKAKASKEKNRVSESSGPGADLVDSISCEMSKRL